MTEISEGWLQMLTGGLSDMVGITGEEGLQELIEKVLEHAGVSSQDENTENWLISPYSPTPTIIEAARTLYEIVVAR